MKENFGEKRIESHEEKSDQEFTAFEIILNIRKLENEDKREEAEDFKSKAVKAGFNLQAIYNWESKNPDLSLGQLLEKAGIKPDEKFKFEKLEK